MSIDDVDKFEKKEVKKIRLTKNIPEPIRKSVGGLKTNVISLFKTNTPWQRVYGQNYVIFVEKES